MATSIFPPDPIEGRARMAVTTAWWAGLGMGFSNCVVRVERQ
jgi:hypothetical protein